MASKKSVTDILSEVNEMLDTLGMPLLEEDDVEVPEGNDVAEDQGGDEGSPVGEADEMDATDVEADDEADVDKEDTEADDEADADKEDTEGSEDDSLTVNDVDEMPDEATTVDPENLANVISDSIKKGYKVQLVVTSEGAMGIIQKSKKKGKEVCPPCKPKTQKKDQGSSKKNEAIDEILSTVRRINHRVSCLEAKNAQAPKKPEVKKPEVKKPLPTKKPENKKSTINESLLTVMSTLAERVVDLENRLTGASNVSKFNESLELDSDLYTALQEADAALDMLAEQITYENSFGPSFGLTESYQTNTNNYHNLNNSIYKISTVLSETAYPFLESITSINMRVLSDMEMLRQISSIAKIEEANSAMHNMLSTMRDAQVIDKIQESNMSSLDKSNLIVSIQEASQMASDAEGFDSSMGLTSSTDVISYNDKRFSGSLNMKDGDISAKAEGADASVAYQPLPLDKVITTKLTPNSAMSAISEAFISKTGQCDIANLSKAFLASKVQYPRSIDDFVVPIATVNENKELVAVPHFIEYASKILLSEDKLLMYKIDPRMITELRNKITPYLQELGKPLPWQQ